MVLVELKYSTTENGEQSVMMLGIYDARIVCRQLGYTNAAKALQGNDVPDGTGQIWLDNVVCTGTERNLTSCSHRGWGIHNCGHHEDAGVECFLHSSTGIVISAFSVVSL